MNWSRSVSVSISIFLFIFYLSYNFLGIRAQVADVKQAIAEVPNFSCFGDNDIIVHGPMSIQFAPSEENNFKASSADIGRNVGIVFGESTQYDHPTWKDFALSLRTMPLAMRAYCRFDRFYP